ncbi:MAG: ABC transporter ATP-binding protein, partial [Clostridia bacterium]|nr:ABC transporter ATP-binding protein [Clostridia bacterium]
MFKRFLQCVREYRTATILTLIFIIGESIIECLIPFITANLINSIKDGAPFSTVIQTGLILASLAILSLCCGGIAGFTCAKASAGFAKNLRHDLFHRIQDYSFENIDKFSTASLVTRMTTDVSNVQMSYMMIIRIAVRAPLMLIFSVIMAFIMGGALAASFVVIIPVLIGGLLLIARKAMPSFRRVFKKYDRLNESIEENVRAMRVVKGFAREDYEKEKFGAASEDIRKDFTRAERLVALNTPLMQFCVHVNMIFVLSVGAYLIVSSGGTLINVGEITAMLTYGMQILMQLMMISMIYVMLTMSGESMKRIVEVLEETPSLSNPQNPVCNVADGSVDFDNVNFKYSAKAKRNSLSDVEIHIPSGATVGIIGGTGSGKSSFVQLIPRLYDATEGTVRVGGLDVRAYDIETLRSEVAMVLQKNLLFSGT